MHGRYIGSQHKLHTEQGGVRAPVCRQVHVEQALGVAHVYSGCCRANLCICRHLYDMQLMMVSTGCLE